MKRRLWSGWLTVAYRCHLHGPIVRHVSARLCSFTVDRDAFAARYAERFGT